MRMMIRGLDDGQISKMVERCIWVFSGINHGGEEYGYFSVFDGRSGNVILARCIGICPEEKADKLFLLSLERGKRLSQHMREESSWQSRDPNGFVFGQPADSTPWGFSAGAVRSHNLILSLAGTSSDLGDEAVILFFLVQAGWMRQPQAYSIASASRNDFFDRMIHSGVSISA